MTVTDQIADLILQDPSISVREITQRLGYAEEKTIYYWILKRGFHGIRAFKRAVLTGQYRVLTSARETAGRPGRLPIADHLSKSGEPLLTGETLPITLDRGRGLFVWRYSGPVVAHVKPGDYLVVGPVDIEHAEWVLVMDGPGQAAIRAVVHPGDGRPWLFDYTESQVDRKSSVIGTILQLSRLFRPATP